MQVIIYLGSKIVIPFVKLYWFIFRPKIYGVKCVIEHDRKILLVRHSYGKRLWGFTGGNIKNGEKIADAVKREVKEELGIELANVKHIGEFIDTSQYVQDFVHCFLAKIENEDFKIDKLEILEAKWWPIDSLPVLSNVKEKVLDI